MGVNYYVCDPKAPDRYGMHIGKSSGGWCFALRVYPEYSLTTFQRWLDFLAKLPEPCVMDCGASLYTTPFQLAMAVLALYKQLPPRAFQRYPNGCTMYTNAAQLQADGLAYVEHI